MSSTRPNGDDALGRADATSPQPSAPASTSRTGRPARRTSVNAASSAGRFLRGSGVPTNSRYGGSSGARARTAREQRVDRVRDHAQVAVRHAEQADGVARGRARDADHPVGVAQRARHQRAPVAAAPGGEPARLAQHREVVHRDDHGQPGRAQRPAERRAVQQVARRRARLPGEAGAVPAEVLAQRVALLAERAALLELALAERDDLGVARGLQRAEQADAHPRGAGAASAEAGDVERDPHRG